MSDAAQHRTPDDPTPIAPSAGLVPLAPTVTFVAYPHGKVVVDCDAAPEVPPLVFRMTDDPLVIETALMVYAESIKAATAA